MLLDRSIFLQICLLLTITQCNCQNYDYGAEEGDDGDHSEVQEESDHPDYSKYYSVDSSSPLSHPQGGFSPEFAEFYSPIEFGASQQKIVQNPKNPFVQEGDKLSGFVASKQQFPNFQTSSDTFPKDYFEEAQKEQRKEENKQEGFEVIPGPSYISHQVPSRYSADEEDDDDDKPAKITKPKNSKNYDYEEKLTENFKSPDYSSEYSSPGKYADYNTGKSSSTVAQHPRAPGQYEQYTKTATPSPYQKYSFQPATEGYGYKSKYLGALLSTAAPFNPAYNKVASTLSTPLFESQPSENIPSHLEGKNCKQIKKPISESGRSKREAMNCFVCEGPESSSKYTQCSYTSEPNPTNLYSGNSERYSTPAKYPDGFRYKRYSGDEYSDPYEYIKTRSQKAQETKDYDEYKFPEYYEEAPDKSFSELQSEEVKNNPGNCHKETKSGMTCTICKDPKTGGNYEQCSYTSEPKEKKFAYVTEKKYDSNDEPEEGSESKPVSQTKDAQIKKSPKAIDSRRNDDHRFEDSRVEERRPVDRQSKGAIAEDDPKAQHEESGRLIKKLIDDENYDIPKHFIVDTAKNPTDDVRGLDPALYGPDPDSSEAEETAPPAEKSSPYKDAEEYHFKLFPEFNRQESKQEQVLAKTPDTTERKDVEEVLAEFSKKDRSACKKAEKNGMTCYLCVDAKGIQHEECMYVSESKPQASHLAYHEVKQVKSPDHETDYQVEPTAASSDLKRKRFFKKVTTPSPFSLVEAASEEIEAKIKSNKQSKNRRRKNKKAKEEVAASNRFDSERLSDDGEPTLKTPVEFDIGENEGAYSAETKPVFSKHLGVKLPKYMIEKTEFEKEFDEFSQRH